MAGKDSKNPKLYNVQHLSELAESPLCAETNYVKDNVYGAVYAGEVIARESSPGSLHEYRSALTGCRLSDQANRLGL